MSNGIALFVRFVTFVLALGVVGAGSAFALRIVFPNAWQARVRRWWRISVGVAVASLLVWFLGRAIEESIVVRAAAPIFAVVFMAGLLVFATSPLWASFAFVSRRVVPKLPVDEKRRAFLARAAGVLPATAAFAGPVGAVASTTKPRLHEVELKNAGIPPALDGYRILQISDVHLGPFIDVAQVEAVVDAAREKDPHLVALTGDIADDYDLLAPALKSIASLGRPMLAILGNHEIFRGRDDAIRMFREAGARFLCNDGVVLEHNGARFFVAGTDDPARLRGDVNPFYERVVAECANACPNDADIACKILLAHRPLALDYASLHGFAIQLSGHTHGAQMALFGRSLLEGLIPMKYLLGTYDKGPTTLYTTAGLGHWFPFRLNCPAEAALITLRSA